MNYEPEDFVLYDVRCKIDGRRLTEGPAELKLYGDVVMVDGELTFRTADWAGPTAVDWRDR